MPLTQDQEAAEHELRIRQMAVSIEQMEANIAKTKADMRRESRLAGAQIMIAVAAAIGATAGAMTYFHPHPAPAPPQVIYMIPGPPPQGAPR